MGGSFFVRERFLQISGANYLNHKVAGNCHVMVGPSSAITAGRANVSFDLAKVFIEPSEHFPSHIDPTGRPSKAERDGRATASTSQRPS